MSFQQQQQQQQVSSSFEQPQPREGSSAPSPCVKGCGFYGSPGTHNMCSVCFKMQHHLVAATGEPAAAAAMSSASNKAASVVVAPPYAAATGAAAPAATGAEAETAAAVEEEEEALTLTAAELKHRAWVERCRAEAAKNFWDNRCRHCNRKMALVGRFQCRCGKTYCPTHRHPEDHACAYDYQRAGRIAIRCSNPLVQGDKLRDRI